MPSKIHGKSNPADKVETWELERLTPYARNSRTHSDAQVAQLAASIREWGWTTPVLVDDAGGIIAGHGRVLAARQLGMTTVPVVVAEGWSDAKKRAYVIADNKLALNAGWDEELLKLEIGELGELGFDLDLLGFDDEELKGFDAPEGTEGQTDPDEVPDAPAVPVSQTGDVWLLGRHRVMCGDSGDNAIVAMACGGAVVGVTVVDPPYDCPDSVWDRWIADPCIVFGQARHIRRVPDALWRFERVVIKRYRHRSPTVQIDHRHAFVAQCGSVRTLPGTSETFASVIEQEIDREHDHAKPVALIVEHLTKWTPPWDTCIDPFAGSGSTVIAAETIGRSCVAMELDPRYVDVIVKRWQDFTGQRATHEATGKPFGEV